jgi:hypothetical protein
MATPDAPTTAQSLLALYGALDRAVTSTGNPEIEAIVERYLPGSTGANAGWYDELLAFLASLLPEFAEPVPVPNLLQALTALRTQGAMTAGQSQGEPAQGETGTATATAVAPGPPTEQQPLSTVQKSRMTYVIGALSHLPDWYQPDESTGRISELDEAFWRTLAVAGGPANSGLLDALRLDFNDRAAFPAVMQFSSRNGLIDKNVALMPMCQPKLVTAHGHSCIVLTTEFESQTVSLDDLKNVIDPLNWARCLSSFFCKMTEKDVRVDGWSRVLEHVSTTCWIPETHLRTPLKYWKSQGQDEQSQRATACINYALDDAPLPDAKGNGVFVVDEGFIRMTSTEDSSAKPGVRVRTRKVAGIRNLSLTPLGILACSEGYGEQGLVMLVDGVAKRQQDPAAGWTDWKPSTPPPARGSAQAAGAPTQTARIAGDTFEPDAGEPPPAPPTDGGTGESAQEAPTGTDTSRRAVELAVEMLNECIDDMAKNSAAIATKWANGAVPIADTMAYTTDLAVRLATDPWRYLERLRYPAQGGDK